MVEAHTSDRTRTLSFPLVERYLGIRMGLDMASLIPGEVKVVETPLHLKREESYGYVRALWCLWLSDGRSAVSVPPGAGKSVTQIASGIEDAEQLLDPRLAEQLAAPVNGAMRKAGLKEVDRILRDVTFACNASLLRRHVCGKCRRLTDESLPAAPGLKLPTHCFPDGIVYGVVADGAAVSIAFAHRTGVMEDLIADLGIETAADYRRRGYAKTAVSAVVEHITRNGGEAYYGCRPDNVASIATARSVGFVPYGTSLILSTPASDRQLG